MDRTKIIYLDNAFVSKSDDSSQDGVPSVLVEGYASTNDVDRHGDIVPTSVWEAGIKQYLNNPVILAYHKHTQPVGRMVEHKVDSKGLWIKARISAAAEDVYNLVKDGLITAFSIGFRILDAEYNQATELFVVKELELHEISVVSVPANQNTLFSLAKSFESDTEYQNFKLHFAPKSESAKGLESNTEAESTTKEFIMDPKEIEKMVAEATAKALKQAEDARVAAEKAAAEKVAAEKAAAEAAAKVAVEVGQSGAEKLMAEVEKRLSEQAEMSTKAIADLQTALKEKSAEIEAMQRSKMVHNTKDQEAVSYSDKEKAVILAKMAGKRLEDTKFGKAMAEKALGAGAATGAHLPSQTWEHEVSLQMEDEIRRRLVIAPLLRSIQMQTNVMTIPVNPEAGFATWVTNAQFGTSASAGAAQTHQLKEITLNSYKVATSEYMAYEEEEDSLIAIMPIVRDAIVRRVSKSVDKAFLIGAGTGGDPVKGLAVYDAASAVTKTVTANPPVTIAEMRALRADLGVWGLDPADVVYVVSTEVYYNLLEDTSFQTMDKVGSNATILTGQIGAIGNSPVIVSGSFAAKGVGAVGAIALNARNFIVGNQRGLRIDTDSLVETQRRVLVASLRTGMTQVSTVDGMAVSALRYVA